MHFTQFRHLALGVGFVALGATSSAASGVTMPATAPLKPHVYNLPNGLRVALLEDPAAPAVTVEMWVRTGSADEVEGEYGLAHVHEHMLFKGTEKRGVGQISKDVESNGGDINAFTSYDQTVYFVTMPARSWAMGMDVIADSIRFSTFDPTELSKELEVVLEEVRRGEDSPDRKLGQELFGLTFLKHPYKRPIIGYSKTVEAFTREGILAFYRKWYAPNNMTLVVAGNVPRAEFEAKVQELYGNFEKRKLPKTDRSAEPKQKDARASVVRFDTEQPKFAMGFRSVASGHKDAIALDILSEMLSSGINSVLFQEMKLKQDLAVGVGAYNYTPLDGGVFEFEASFEPAKLERGLTRLISLVKAADIWNYDVGELEAIKSRLVSEFAKSMETTSGRAHQLGSFLFYHNDPDYAAKYLEAVRSLTLADLRKVAKKYLSTQPANLVLMLPESSTETWDQARLLELWSQTDPAQSQPAAAHAEPQVPSAADKAMGISSQRQINGSITEVKFANGLTLLVREDHRAPLISIGSYFAGGVSHETAATAGWFSQLAGVWPYGTGELGPEQIDRLHSLLGGGTSAWSERDGMGLSGWYISQNAEKAVRLYSALLTAPTLPENLFEVNRNRTLQKLVTLKDNLFRYGLKHFLSNFYGEHPYNHLSEGSEESLKALTRADLMNLHRNHVRPEGAYIAVVGDIHSADVIRWFQHSLAGWQGAPAGEPARAAAKARKALEQAAVPVQKEQTHIWWGFPGLTIRDNDRYTLDVMDAILSGMGGRLFMRLRDELSLAYTVTSIQVTPQDPGFFAFYIAGQPDKEAIALSEFEAQRKRLTDENIPVAELNAAKTYLMGSRDIARERLDTTVSLMLQSVRTTGNPADFEKYAEHINAVSAADIQRVARRVLKPEQSLQLILRSDKTPGKK